MNKGKIFTLPFKRKREGRTYYKKRLRMLSSGRFRFVIRKSLRNFQASVIEYNPKGDKVLFTVNTKTLEKFGWKGDAGNLPSAYLVGMVAGKKAIDSGIKEAILDLGFNNSTAGSRLYAALAGAVEAGLKIPYNPEVLPRKDRISGEHIATFAKLLKNDKGRYEKQFNNYLKRGINPEDIVKHINEVKVKIHG